MKNCPTCGSQYTDDTLSFCLSDGARLLAAADDGEITVVLGETETIVRPASGGSHLPGISPQPRKSRTWLAVLLTAIGMLVLFGIFGIAGFLVLRSMESQRAGNNGENRAVASPTTLPTPKPTATPGKATPTPVPTPTVEKTPDTRAKYASTTRLTMKKGAYSTAFSGEINPGDSRTFLLASRSGQSLSADLSGDSCVNFRGGGSSFSRTTLAGDNSITVTNNCSATARFSLRVSIF